MNFVKKNHRDFLIKQWLVVCVLRYLVSEGNSRLEREHATRSKRLATRLASLQGSMTSSVQRQQQRSGLPGFMLTDNYGAVTSGDETIRFASYENRRINNEYSRRLPDDDDSDDNEYTRRFDDGDDLSSIHSFQLRPGRFGGISRRYRNNEFGRDPSILLTGDDASRAEHPTSNSDASVTPATFKEVMIANSANRSSHHDDDDASSVANVQLRPSRFGGISQMSRHRDVFGSGPSTLLSGRHGRLSSCIAADEVETTVRGGRAVDDGDAVASQRDGGSVLANWPRRRDSQRQAPRVDHVEMQPQGSSS